MWCSLFHQIWCIFLFVDAEKGIRFIWQTEYFGTHLKLGRLWPEIEFGSESTAAAAVAFSVDRKEGPMCHLRGSLAIYTIFNIVFALFYP